jgi:epoxyqueuosine reductase
VTSSEESSSLALKQSIKDEARRLGFVLAGVTIPDPPPHASVFENWVSQGRHAGMHYLADRRTRLRRGDPRLIMPECKSILVLAVPYSNPGRAPEAPGKGENQSIAGKTAAYAWGDDYHVVLPKRLKAIVQFIEKRVGHPVSSRSYTDSGPILERDLAQRAGLGWIGKNTCLINPKIGSYFLLAEVFLDLEIEPDPPFPTDHCGTCTRCIEACPTGCILPDRTLDSSRCISYLTIELREEIPCDLRSLVGNWVFGCDICQMACPWNRFAPPVGDMAFGSHDRSHQADLIQELEISSGRFEEKFRGTPIKRTKHSGYRRNVATALGNAAGVEAIPALRAAAEDMEPLVAEHAAWAIGQIRARADAGV